MLGSLEDRVAKTNDSFIAQEPINFQLRATDYQL
jgi:hypothetical protein